MSEARNFQAFSAETDAGRGMHQTRRRIKSGIAKVMAEGFWYCRTHDGRCEREEGEQGQPAHCSECGSPRIEWTPPYERKSTDTHQSVPAHV